MKPGYTTDIHPIGKESRENLHETGTSVTQMMVTEHETGTTVVGLVTERHSSPLVT